MCVGVWVCVYACVCVTVTDCLQGEMERAAIYLRNSPVKLEDMVDECEDYIICLRNLAIEVQPLLSPCI